MREGRIQFSGEPAALSRARAVFSDLEAARRKGGLIEQRDFRLAVEVAARVGGVGLSELSGVRSGLAEAEHALQGIEGIAFLEFSKSDIIRHPVVGRIVEAYERYRE